MINSKLKTFKKLWTHLCPATKSIFIIGITCFLSTSISIFHMTSFSDPSDIAIRSIMSSIFGFIFGDQIIPNSNVKNKRFQTFVASTIALGSLLVVILTQWIAVNQSGSALVEIRNLMFASVGFLVSRSKSIEAAEINANFECECEFKKSKDKDT